MSPLDPSSSFQGGDTDFCSAWFETGAPQGLWAVVGSVGVGQVVYNGFRGRSGRTGDDGRKEHHREQEGHYGAVPAGSSGECTVRVPRFFLI